MCEDGIIVFTAWRENKKVERMKEPHPRKGGEEKSWRSEERGVEKEQSGSPTLDDGEGGRGGGGFHCEQMTNRRFEFDFTDVRGKQHHDCRQQRTRTHARTHQATHTQS